MQKAEKGEYPEPKLVYNNDNGVAAIQVNNFQTLFDMPLVVGKKPADLSGEEIARLKKLFDN